MLPLLADMPVDYIIWKIFEILNYVMIGITTITFLFQIVMIIFFWLKEKHFPQSEDYHSIAIIIPAHNEADVIGETVKLLLEKQTYPKELFDVYVIADNCIDNTASVAQKAGAHVLIHRDDDPKHHCVAYALKYGIDALLNGEKNYDILIRFDADNHAKEDYLRVMNDAFCAGVEIARPFEASLNPTQNTWAAVSAAYYVRDSRIASNFRENIHTDSMLTGAGMMVAMKVLREIGGWDAMGLSEDAEFTINRMLENRRVHYVADAVVFEDQPSTMKDNFARLSRMGHGLHRLFYTHGFRLFGHFFRSGRWGDVDLFVQLMTIPVDVICYVWFVLYYATYTIILFLQSLGVQVLSFMTSAEALATLGVGMSWGFWQMVVLILAIYLIVYPLQTFFAVAATGKEKLGLTSYKGFKRGILLSSIFTIFWGVCIVIGVFKKPRWSKVSRNPKSQSKE